MGSRLAGIVTSLSFGLLLLAAVGWFRTTYAFDEITATLGCNFRVISTDSSIEFRLLSFPDAALPRPLRWYNSNSNTSDVFTSGDPYDHPPYLTSPLVDFSLGRFMLRLERWTAPTGYASTIQLPYALLILLFAIAPGLQLYRRINARKLQAHQLLHHICPYCGFDSQHAKEFCPECGKPLAHKITLQPPPPLPSRRDTANYSDAFRRADSRPSNQANLRSPF